MWLFITPIEWEDKVGGGEDETLISIVEPEIVNVNHIRLH
jgi:hypothetical protein